MNRQEILKRLDEIDNETQLLQDESNKIGLWIFGMVLLIFTLIGSVLVSIMYFHNQNRISKELTALHYEKQKLTLELVGLNEYATEGIE